MSTEIAIWELVLLVTVVVFVPTAALQWYEWYRGEYEAWVWKMAAYLCSAYYAVIAVAAFFFWNWIVALVTFAGAGGAVLTAFSIKRIREGSQ